MQLAYNTQSQVLLLQVLTLGCRHIYKYHFKYLSNVVYSDLHILETYNSHFIQNLHRVDVDNNPPTSTDN